MTQFSFANVVNQVATTVQQTMTSGSPAAGDSLQVGSTTNIAAKGYALCGTEIIYYDAVDGTHVRIGTSGRGALGSTAASHAIGDAIYFDVIVNTYINELQNFADQLVVNVMSPAFGAKGDGITDDAPAIQAAINAAGADGAVAFGVGVYLIGTELIPAQRQTWWLSAGAVFRPTGNNRILNIVSRSKLSFHGTLAIEDPSAHSTSVAAIRIEDVTLSYFERITITNYYRGMDLYGPVGTNENYFGDIYMQVRDRGINLETSCHDNHFNHVWCKGPSPTSWATGSGLRIATSGTQGGNTFDQIEVLDMNTGLDLPGAFETWFGQVVVDNSYGNGIYMAGSCERVFFGTVWTASGGDGIVFDGNNSDPPTSYADKIYFDKVYSWLNAGYGVRFLGYATNVVFGTLVVQRNDKGLAFEGSTNYEILISELISFENTTFGVDATDSANVFVGHAIISDVVIALNNLQEINGVRPGTGLFKNVGTCTITNGNTSVVVTHGLEATPKIVLLDPQHAETAGAYVSARGTTTFTVTVSAAVTADRVIGWFAESRRY